MLFASPEQHVSLHDTIYLLVYLFYVSPQLHKVYENEQVINLVPDCINSAQYNAWLGVGTPNV